MSFRNGVSGILVLFLCTFFSATEIIAQKCVGGLDSIQQVKVRVALQDSVTIEWPAHAANCYTLQVGNSVVGVISSGKVNLSKAALAAAGDSLIIINERCNGSVVDPCTGTTESMLYYGAIPPLDSVGLWMYQFSNMSGVTGSGSVFTNRTDSALVFTTDSPSEVPNLVTAARLTGQVNTVVRPTCMGDTDGSFSFTLNYLADAIDSFTYAVSQVGVTGNVDTSSSPIILDSISTSNTFNITSKGAGQYEIRVHAFSSSIQGSIAIPVTVGTGSDEPVVACNSDLNLGVDGQCMVDINSGMILAGISSPCATNFMDSLVVKLTSGVVVPTINVGSGAFDTIRIEDASQLIGVPLMLEVHSSNDTVSNTCWGNLLLEDKIAPTLVCDTSITISCFDFNGGSLDHIQTMDCDTNPTINIINQQTITDCSVLPDSLVKRIVRTFNAVDKYGNVSTTCSDTLNITRLDADMSNNPTGAIGVLDIPGLVYPLHHIINNNLSSKLDTTPFVCDTRFPFADENNDNIPDPIDFIVKNGDTLRGAGLPQIDTIINGDTLRFKFHPSNVANPDTSVARMLEFCKTVTTYRDVVLSSIGCVQKIDRTWTINEWVCGSQTQREFTQLIEIQDSVGPGLKAAADMKVTTNQNSCTRRMLIPPLDSLFDYCTVAGSPDRVVVNVHNSGLIGTLSTDASTFSLTTGGFLNLPKGKDTVVYIAFDQCHNTSTDTMIIEVVDETAPVMICKEFVTLGLSSDSGVKLPAQALDNGSFDDCSMGGLCVVRMNDQIKFDSLFANGSGGTLTDGTNYVNLSSFTAECGVTFTKSGTTNAGVDYIIKADLCTPHIEYCCADGGVRDTVILQGTDKAGNTNQCMVVVEVQDKRSPVLHCPPDLTIDCRYDFVTDSVYSIFGNVVTQGAQQPINIPQSQILGIESGKGLSDGVWFGNCSATVNVSAKRVVDKCSAGTIERTFSVTANGITTSCIQTITISRDSVIKASDIVFPADTTIIGCGIPSDYEPSVTGRPVIDEDGCTLLGDAHTDLTVRFNDQTGDACFKILREWTIIDWCKEPSVVIARKTQVIKLRDTIAPIINSGMSCADTVLNVSSCNAEVITLTQSATDRCTDTENILWSVQIDLNNNGVIDQTKNITATSDKVESIATLQESFAIGTHRVVWEARDQCGNSSSCTQLVRVQNGLLPNAICRTSITGPLSPVASGGELVVWADEYNIGSSSHPCGYSIIYSFDSLSLVHSKTLTCADYNPVNGANSVELENRIYVHAVEITTNNGQSDTTLISVSSCSGLFVLSDPNDLCGANQIIIPPVVQGPPLSEGLVQIGGNIRTESGQNIATVQVDLDGVNSSASTLATSTDLDGLYAFPSMSIGESYELSPSLKDDVLNGVSTLDLVLIQKQILGLDNFESPYKLIAADVNNDEIISAIDLIELRKVILDVQQEFTNNSPWRFVDADYEFRDVQNALKEDYPSSYRISELESDMNIDFIGIKIGDVNETVNVNGLLTNPRSQAAIRIVDQDFIAGEVVSVPIVFAGAGSLIGYQFGFNYDVMSMALSGYGSESIDLSSANFGMKNINVGKVNTSWSAVNAITLDGSASFTLEFIAKRSGRLSEVLSLDKSASIQAEMYTESLDQLGLTLEFLPGKGMNYDEFVLLQNSPNPFSESTEISFVMPQKGEATLKVYDINGVLIKQVSESYAKGMNSVTLSKKELGVSAGVLIYSIENEGFIATKEMILID